MPTTEDAVKILQESLLKNTRCGDGFLRSAGQLPIYDLSNLSEEELRIIMDYLRVSKEISDTREMLERKLSFYIPSVAVASENKQPQSICRTCGRCSTRLSFAGYYLKKTSSIVCFVCNKVCCQRCMRDRKCKIPSTGSFTLREICIDCFTVMAKQEAQNWLEHGRCLLESDERKADTAIAMYRISNTIYRTEKSMIYHVEALYAKRDYTRLVEYVKRVLQETAPMKENLQVFVSYVAKSLLELANAADKRDCYEKTVEWIKRIDAADDVKMRELKLMATKMKPNSLREHHLAIQKKAIRVSNNRSYT